MCYTFFSYIYIYIMVVFISMYFFKSNWNAPYICSNTLKNNVCKIKTICAWIRRISSMLKVYNFFLILKYSIQIMYNVLSKMLFKLILLANESRNCTFKVVICFKITKIIIIEKNRTIPKLCGFLHISLLHLRNFLRYVGCL